MSACGVLIADGNLIRFRHEVARRATQAQIPDFDRIVVRPLRRWRFR
jgi:hypothetical protein